jgi:hypothetical protein
LNAYWRDDEPCGPPELPPVGKVDLGRLGYAKKVIKAMEWAEEVGWRPAYRMKPYKGRRWRNDDGGGWYETERSMRVRLREQALERSKQRETSEGEDDETGPENEERKHWVSRPTAPV